MFEDETMNRFAQFHEKWKEIVFTINKNGDKFDA